METKKSLHIALLIVLLAGTIFAWYNSAMDICTAGGACIIKPSAMLGLPVCIWGAIFFTIALVLAVAMWFIKE
jgi:hypothetical protein